METFRRPLVGDRIHSIVANAANEMVIATLTVRHVQLLACGRCYKATSGRPGQDIGHGIGWCFAEGRCNCGGTHRFRIQLPNGAWLLDEPGSPVRDYRQADIDRLVGMN